jgi:hypothetical protein
MAGRWRAYLYCVVLGTGKVLSDLKTVTKNFDRIGSLFTFAVHNEMLPRNRFSGVLARKIMGGTPTL